MSRIEGAVNKSMSLVGAVARKLRDSPLTAAARTMEVAGDSIDTPPFSDRQEAIDAWVGKDNPSPRGFFAFLAAKYASKAVMSAPMIIATLLDNSSRLVVLFGTQRGLIYGTDWYLMQENFSREEKTD